MLSTSSPLLWGIFLTGVTGMLLADLLILNRRAHKPTVRESAVQSLIWITISVVIGGAIWAAFGASLGAQYFTGYIIEKSLSVDNIFVWGLVLGFFNVPDKYKHRVLFWGIFGAILMRFIFIAAGVQLINRFDFLVPILGLVLLYSAAKILKSDDDDYDVANSKAYQFFTKHLRTSKGDHGGKFFVRLPWKANPPTKTFLQATPLFLCLLVVEVTDVIFAVDSVPAILSVSNNTFVIFASNVMAILGLRALFFLFDAIKDKFRFLGTGVAIVLAYVGVKMLLQSHFLFLPGIHIPTPLSLGVIATVLGGSVLASTLIKEKEE